MNKKIIEYQLIDYKAAISYFSHANNYQINTDFTYLTSFWLADCYFQLANNKEAAELYANLIISNNKSNQKCLFT